MRGFFAVLGLLPGLALGQVANSSIQTLPDTAQGDMVWVDLHELSVQQILYMPFAAHFESGPYQLFSPNTAAANSISGNLSGVCVSAWVHPHFTVELGLQDAQSQALTETGELLYLDQMRWAGLMTTGYLVGLQGGWDLSASVGWGYARSSFTETPGVPLVYHQTGYPWVLRVQGHYRNRMSPFVLN
ncbi:MAG TPA: hypothetical protein DDY62_03145, partial [Cryomorphaceae bacterium]|nr:hypothetical protein [Cryomorphaceae bacterium]